MTHQFEQEVSIGSDKRMHQARRMDNQMLEP